MRHFKTIALALAWLLAAGIADAQQASLKWRSASLAPDSGAARVYVTPIEDNGSIGAGLNSQNFEATLDGKRVPIRRVSAGYAVDEGLGVALLLDTSGSMRGAGIHAARQAAIRFVSQLGKNDQVAVINFDDAVHVRQNFTTDKRAVSAAIQSAEAVGQHTVLFDAIHKAASLPASVPPGRRAIVLLTDGHDEGSSLKADDIAHLALDNKLLPVYAIGLGQSVDHAVLHRFGTVSGGADLYAPDPGALSGLYANVGRRLADVYDVQVDSPPADGRSHVLEVTWVRPGGMRLSAAGSLATNMAPPAPTAIPGAQAAGTGGTGAGARANADTTPKPPISPAAISGGAGKGNDHTRNILIGASAVFALALLAGFRMRHVSMHKSQPAPVTQDAQTTGANTAPNRPLNGTLASDYSETGRAHTGVEQPRYSYDSANDNARETQYGRGGLSADKRNSSSETMIMQPAQIPSRAWLMAVRGPMKDREFKITGREAIIGRAGDVQISLADDGQVSRRHAKIITNDDGSCSIMDMASTNGIQVNSERVYQQQLRDGDTIELGDSALIFKTLHSSDPADSQASGIMQRS